MSIEGKNTPIWPIVVIGGLLAGYVMWTDGGSTEKPPATFGTTLEDQVVSYGFQGKGFDAGKFIAHSDEATVRDLTDAQRETLANANLDPAVPRNQAIGMCAVEGASLHAISPDAANEFKLGHFEAARDDCRTDIQSHINDHTLLMVNTPVGLNG